MTPKTMMEATTHHSEQTTGIAPERIVDRGCERCARRPEDPDSSWDRCRPVELSVGDHAFLDLHIHSTLRIHPEPMLDEPWAEPGDVDLWVDDGAGPIAVAMSATQARLLARRMLAASAEHEWLAERDRRVRATAAVRGLRTLDDDALHDQEMALQRRIERVEQDRCDLLATDDTDTRVDQLWRAQATIAAELRRRGSEPDEEPNYYELVD